MTYSSALFAADDDGTPLAAGHLLADAQRRKIDCLLDRAGVGRAAGFWRSAPAGVSWPSAPRSGAPPCSR